MSKFIELELKKKIKEDFKKHLIENKIPTIDAIVLLTNAFNIALELIHDHCDNKTIDEIVSNLSENSQKTLSFGFNMSMKLQEIFLSNTGGIDDSEEIPSSSREGE